MRVYPVNYAIKVRFLALGGQTGITDLQMVVTDPTNTDGSPITMVELSNGLYEASFTPNSSGRWWVKITSTNYPENTNSFSYFVNLTGNLPVEIPPSVSNRTVQFLFDKETTAYNNYEWQDVAEYTVPVGYDLNAISFSASSDVSNERARIISRNTLGLFNCATNTFTDQDSVNSPVFSSRLYLYVTTAIGSGSADTITITYTNSLGVTGRTATAIIPKNSIIGTRIELILQSGDIGVSDITNITHSATGQAGAFTVYGIVELFYLILTSSNVLYQSPATSVGGVVVLEGEKLYLQYKANSGSINRRRLSFIATLVEKTL